MCISTATAIKLNAHHRIQIQLQFRQIPFIGDLVIAKTNYFNSLRGQQLTNDAMSTYLNMYGRVMTIFLKIYW